MEDKGAKSHKVNTSEAIESVESVDKVASETQNTEIQNTEIPTDEPNPNEIKDTVESLKPSASLIDAKMIALSAGIFAAGVVLGILGNFVVRKPVTFNHYTFSLNNIPYEITDNGIVYDFSAINADIDMALKSNTDAEGNLVIDNTKQVPSRADLIQLKDSSKNYIYAEYDDTDGFYNVYCNLNSLKYDDYGIAFSFSPDVIIPPKEEKINDVQILEEQVNAKKENKEEADRLEAKAKEDEERDAKEDQSDRIKSAAEYNKALYVTDEKIKGSLGVDFIGKNGEGEVKLLGVDDKTFIFYQYITDEDFTITYPGNGALKNGDKINVSITITNPEALNLLPLEPDAKLNYEYKVSGLEEVESEEDEGANDNSSQNGNSRSSSSTEFHVDLN